jgi:eukaryotic-like serine/threonine-protein kinase
MIPKSNLIKSLVFSGLVSLAVIVSACGIRSKVATVPASLSATFEPSDTVTITPSPAPTETPTQTLTPLPVAGSTKTSPNDDMVMVYVPEGDFSMGNDAIADEKPVHTVTLSAFWIDQTEVTTAMYMACEKAKVCQKPSLSGSYSHEWYYGNLKYANYPVVFVSFVDARDYCTWVGRRLPTEAEWEKAARGTDSRIYPWGNTAPNCSLANFTSNGRTCFGDPASVGSYPNGSSPYGALDMAGNVSEWVNDHYDPGYYSVSPQNNPPGSDKSDYRVVRGGSWYTDDNSLRITNRYFENPFNSYSTLGFRCASDVAP